MKKTYNRISKNLIKKKKKSEPVWTKTFLRLNEKKTFWTFRPLPWMTLSFIKKFVLYNEPIKNFLMSSSKFFFR